MEEGRVDRAQALAWVYRSDWFFVVAWILKLAFTAMLLSGAGREAPNGAKAMIVVLLTSWWLLFYGQRKAERERVEQEKERMWRENFVPVRFSGYILGYGDAGMVEGHVIDRKTFWFQLPDDPGFMYDAPVMNCFGEFERRGIEEGGEEPNEDDYQALHQA